MRTRDHPGQYGADLTKNQTLVMDALAGAKGPWSAPPKRYLFN